MREQRSHDCASLDWPTGPHPTPSGSGLAPTADRSKTPAAGSRSRGIDSTGPVTEAASIHRVATQPGQVASGAGVCGVAGMAWPAPVLGRRSEQWGLWMDGTGRLGSGACAPHGSCDQTRDPPENDPQDGLVGASRRQVKPDLGFQLDHARGDLDQAKAQGVELRHAPL